MGMGIVEVVGRYTDLRLRGLSGGASALSILKNTVEQINSRKQ